MTFDWGIKVTDIIMVIAIISGPIIAVQISEFLRNSQDSRLRRVHIFRTLMATRTSRLALSHIEALNLVEIDFHSSRSQDKRVIDMWKLYLAHLYDKDYPKDTWTSRGTDLLVDLLYEMAVSLGYSYEKAQIKNGTYYPHGYEDAEWDNLETRKLWLEVLRGNRQFPMKAEVYASQQNKQPLENTDNDIHPKP